MKPGDKFPINLNEWVVAEAVVVDIEDGKVTLDVPATRIVMGVKTSLTDLTPTDPAVEHQILGAEDRVTGTAAQPPKTTDANSPTQVSSDNAQGVIGAPVTQNVEQPVANEDISAPNITPGTLPADAIGEGLANVALKEMD